jgi:hypothetical protein
MWWYRNLRNEGETELDVPGIEIIRRPCEEPHYLHIIFTARNEGFQGHLEFYCKPSDIEQIGKALIPFPKQIADEYVFNYGSSNPSDRFAYYFSLGAYIFNNQGHSALRIIIIDFTKRPEKEECHFSIIAEPWAIHRLGVLLVEFSKLKHSVLKWSLNPDDNALLENEQY